VRWRRDAREKEGSGGGGNGRCTASLLTTPVHEKRSLRWKEQGRRSTFPPRGWDGAVPSEEWW